MNGYQTRVHNNKKYVIRISIQSIFVYLTIMYAILFPADKMNVKEVFLFAALFVCLPAIYSELLGRRNTFLAFFGLLYPAFTISLSIVLGDSRIGDAISYGYVWVYLLLIPGIVRYNIDVKKPFIIATLLVATAINFVFLADVFGVISIYSNPVTVFLKKMNELQYGKGIAATFGYSIFYKSCPLIIFSYGYSVFHKKYVLAVYFALSIIACGTRANFYSAVILTVLIVLFTQDKKSKMFIAFAVIVCVATIVAPNIIERMVFLNTIKTRSDSIKTDAIKSIFEFMNQAPYRYIIGSGVGSSFYTLGRNKLTTVVEVSYFDYYRQVGIIGFSLFIYFLVKPMKWLYKHEKWLLFAFLGYLGIAFTNPLLVSSTAFMAYIMIYSCGFSDTRYSLMKKDYFK